MIIISFILVPQIIISQTEQIFGSASPQLSITQRIYLSASLLLQSEDLVTPSDPDGNEVDISIIQGESVQTIIGKLWEAGLITNPGVFQNYLQFTGMDTQLKAGEYRLNPGMTAIEIAKLMQTNISPEVTLVILPGWRLEEIAHSLPSTGLNITPDEFIQSTGQSPMGYSFSDCLGENNLEGFLYPSSYTVLRETTMEQLLPQILMNFEANVSSDMRDGFSAQGLNVCQAVTLASIVEREAMLEEEMPLIASVFYNRLNNGSILASDPTVQYALGYNQEQGTWWTNPLTFQDLKVDSVYNTYIYVGLPPGPISNPGQAALQAVAFPAQTPYFYFRSSCDDSGRHVFAETFNEHLANECP
jgi:UPF0755 protein